MLFSVLVPAFNAESYIEECLDSILCQNFDDYEIIIIDDGSTDRTASICDGYSNRFSNVKVFHWENHGLILARRKAIELAAGDYILFLDADDAHIGESLQALNTIVHDSSPDLVLFRFRFAYESGKVSDSKIFGNKVYRKEEQENLFLDFVSNYEFNHLCCKLIKKSLILQDDFNYESFCKIRLGEDLLQSIPLFSNAETTVCTDVILYKYRFLNNSMSHGFNMQQVEDIEKVYQVLFERLRDLFSDNSKCLTEARCQLDIKLASMLRDVWSSTLTYQEKKVASNKIVNVYKSNQVGSHPNRLVLQNNLLLILSQRKLWPVCAIYTFILDNLR